MRFNTLLSFVFLTLIFVQGCSSTRTGYIPSAADSIAMQLDNQMLQRAGIPTNTKKAPADSAAQARLLRNTVTVMATVPVDLNNLKVTCPLARQISEEISRWLVNAGYSVQELRKAKAIYFQQKQGEMLLTRNTALLANRNVHSQAVLTGTYVTTPEQVRFNIRLIHTPSNEVLAMATGTVPVTADIRPLLINSSGEYVPIEPTVQTRLQ